ANSRGDMCSSAISPRSRARPTTPYRTTGSISSGNSETTPKRYISLLPPARLPIDDDDARIDVDLADDVRHERDQPVAAARQHDHVVRSSRHQVIHLAERLAAQVPDREPLEIRPVIPTRLERRQRAALDADLRAEPTPRLVPIVDAAELRDDVLRGASPRLDLDAVQTAFVLEIPLGVAEDILTRLGVGQDLDPALDAEQAANAA